MKKAEPLKIYDAGRVIEDNVSIEQAVDNDGNLVGVVATIRIMVTDNAWQGYNLVTDRRDLPPDILPTFLRKVAASVEADVMRAEISSCE